MLALNNTTTVVFAPDLKNRLEDWLSRLTTRRADPDLHVKEVSVFQDGVRVRFESDQRTENSLELKPLCLGRQGNFSGKSLAIYVITHEPAIRLKLQEVARELVEWDDGTAVVSCTPAPVAKVPDTYRWLGLGPALATLLFALRARFVFPSPREAIVKRTHLLPIGLQCLFFAYWAIYWPPVRAHLPSLLAQLMFAYVLDVLAAFWLRRPWPGLFAVGAPVLSANLFVWFTGMHLWESFLVVAIAILSKALIRRGEQHIFNPSALGTSVVALMFVVSPTSFQHVDIAFAISSPPNMSELMFLATLVPLVLLKTAPIPVGAAISLLVLQSILGPGPGFTWPGWFLAITIFAGDPATVPRTAQGRLLFGLLVGAGLQFFAMLLIATTGTDFFAKVLPIPFLNLASPWLDRIGEPLFARVSARLGKARALVEGLAQRPVLVWVFLYMVEFQEAKAGGVPKQLHEDWGTPLVRRDPDGSFQCRSNPIFCKPFRCDLEIEAWLRQPQAPHKEPQSPAPNP